MPSLVLVGESPPPGAPPDFAPFDCASGDRLAKHMLGLRSRAFMLAHVRRENVFDTPGTGIVDRGPPWIQLDARERMGAILGCHLGGVVVTLGDRPRAATFGAGMGFGSWIRVDAAPYLPRAHPARYVDVLSLPHPSGRSTAINTDARRSAVRAALLPEVVMCCKGLRPWHFRLDDPTVLRDLAVAISPLHPALAAGALVVAGDAYAHGWAAPAVTEPMRVALADRTLAALARRLAAPDLAPSVAAAEIAALWSAQPTIAKDIISRGRFAAKTIDFSAIDPAVIRATYARHLLRGHGGEV